MDKKILVIDDSTTVRHQVRAALADSGFEIFEAADGVEGLEMIMAQQDLDAVVCDVNMPRMGGLQMLELVKAKGRLPALPWSCSPRRDNPPWFSRPRPWARRAGWSNPSSQSCW